MIVPEMWEALQLCLAPDRCHLGPGQDRIKKKTIQNLIFDNANRIWSQLRKKMLYLYLMQ